MATDATSASAAGLAGVELTARRAAAPRSVRNVARATVLTPQRALAVMIIASALIVSVASAHESVLSPPAHWEFPFWMSGPLGWLSRWYNGSSNSLEWIFTLAVAAMFVSYVFILRRSRELSTRFGIAAVVLLHIVFFLSPPLLLTDVFNYLNYGRMEVVYHLNPYVTVPVLEPHNAATYLLSNWHRLLSPYGPLFTIFSFLLVSLGLAASFWALKLVLMLASLWTLRMVWKSAVLLKRDPLKVTLFVGLNPVVLVWGLGGDHNDFVVMAFLTSSFYLLLKARTLREPLAAGESTHKWRSLIDHAPRPVPAGEAGPTREFSAGVLLVCAVAVKASAGILLPVVLLAVPRRLRLLSGMAIGAIAVAIATLIAFGPHLPDLSDQSSVVTAYAIPNLIGLAVGAGGETNAMRGGFDLLLAVSVIGAALWAWRTGRWLTASGFATFMFIFTLSWLLPWYVLWLLPLAALSSTAWLRRAAIAVTLFLLLTWAPVTGSLLGSIGFNPNQTTVGRAHQVQAKALY